METTIIIIVFAFIIGTYLFDTWLSWLNYANRHQPIPEEVQDVYEEEEYRRWHKYSMEVFRYQMITSLISVIVIIILLATKAFVWFESLAVQITSNEYMQLFLFFAFYYLISFVIGIFESYYSAFVIEEKYGFNKTTKKTFITDKIKQVILTALFGGGLILLLFALYRNFGIMFYVYGWLSLVIIFIIINMIYVKVIVPLFNKLTPLEDGELKEEIEAFATKVGYQVSKISVMDASRRSTKLNAFFSGFGKVKQIVLYDTLIDKMTTDQIVGVLAHEIGHNKYKHIIHNMIRMVITLGLYFAVLMIVLTNDVFSTAFGFDATHFGFAIILFEALLSPVGILISLIASSLSRKAEFQADNYAATQHNKESIEGALKVLSRENFSNLTPHPLYVKMRYSHPPTVERIRAIRKA